MPSYPTFSIRQVYNFDMYAPAILSTGYKGATVLAVMDYETAAREADIRSIHVNVFPFLPDGTPNDFRAYDYIKIKTTAGNTVVLGLAWIKADTVTSVESRTITARITGVGAADVPRVRNALIQNGFTAIDVNISN